jgi:hypothetical protein
MGKKVLHQFVHFQITRGEFTAMSADHYVKDAVEYASGMRAALPFKIIQEWGVKIEVRERSHDTKEDWEKPGRLVKKFT